MSAALLIRPGRTTLADWRAIYRGAPVSLDPIARADVEAGVAGLALAQGREAGPSVAEGAAAGPSVVDFIQKSGDHLPAGLVRLILGLKVASLGQGLSGVRWAVVAQLAECLGQGILPAIPESNAGDRLALSHLFGLLTGAVEVFGDRKPRSAAKALKKAGLAPVNLTATERAALVSGSQPSTAFALAGLFAAERVFQSSLVACALSLTSIGSGAVLHRRVHRLRRQPGEIAVAEALRSLLGSEGGLVPDAAREAATAPATLESRRMTAQLGACLDLLRDAGETLQRAANAVSEGPLVLWQTGEIVAGVEDTSCVQLAGDLTALALCETGLMAERRVGLVSGYGAGADGHAPGGSPPVAMVGGFNAENRQRALPIALGFNAGEGHAAAQAGGGRLLSAAGTAALVLAVEVLVAASAGVGRPGNRPGPLDVIRTTLRERLPQITGEGGFAPTDLAGAAELIRSGDLAAPFTELLPGLVPRPVETPPLGARRNRQ